MDLAAARVGLVILAVAAPRDPADQASRLTPPPGGEHSALMAASHYERLTALDAAFLEIEDENCPMHVGAVAIFDPGPLALAEGGFDIERFTKFVESVLAPRYRQRLDWSAAVAKENAAITAAASRRDPVVRHNAVEACQP